MGSVLRTSTDMDDDKLNLARNDFENSSSHAIKQLKLDTDFLDVTLACEDGNQLKAHKVVLSSFSPVFQSILKQNAHHHPLIYLTDITHVYLQKILDFIYLGETVVNKSEFEEFMRAAEKLKINGLVQDNQSTNVTKQLPGKENSSMIENEANKKEDINEELVYPKQEIIHEDFAKEIFEEKISSKNYSDPNESVQGDVSKNYNNSNKSKFPCNDCQYSATTKSNLKTHVLAKHLGVKFPCHYCNFQGSTKGNTHFHMKMMHNSMK